MQFKVYSQAGRECSWCEKAISLLRTSGHTPLVKPLTRDELIEIAQTYDWSTIPMVFHGDTFIGGYEETLTYVNASE